MPTNTLSVREMERTDISAMCYLAARIWRAHYPGIITHEQIEYMLEERSSPEALIRQLQEEKQRVFLIYTHDTLCGYAGFTPKAEGVWYLDKFYVDTNQHRKGLGSTLLDHCKDILKPKAITLRVNRANIKAINFYLHRGFTIEACDVLKLDHGFVMDDFLMRWTA